MVDSAVTDFKTEFWIVCEKPRKTQILSVSEGGHSKVLGHRWGISLMPNRFCVCVCVCLLLLLFLWGGGLYGVHLHSECEAEI